MSDHASRFNAGKTRTTLLLEAPIAIEGATRVLEYGCTKYSRRNWKKGFPFLEIVDAMMRHTLKFVNGEEFDYEGQAHVDCILVNALFLAELTRTHPHMDDRIIQVRDPETGEIRATEDLAKLYDEYMRNKNGEFESKQPPKPTGKRR